MVLSFSTSLWLPYSTYYISTIPMSIENFFHFEICFLLLPSSLLLTISSEYLLFSASLSMLISTSRLPFLIPFLLQRLILWSICRLLDVAILHCSPLHPHSPSFPHHLPKTTPPNAPFCLTMSHPPCLNFFKKFLPLYSIPDESTLYSTPPV